VKYKVCFKTRHEYIKDQNCWEESYQPTASPVGREKRIKKEFNLKELSRGGGGEVGMSKERLRSGDELQRKPRSGGDAGWKERQRSQYAEEE
jgi:hypothetical protein